MAREPQNSPLFTHIDVSTHASTGAGSRVPADESLSEMAALMHQMVMGQQRQNELLEDLVQQMTLPKNSVPMNWGNGKKPIPAWLVNVATPPRRLAMFKRNSSTT